MVPGHAIEVRGLGKEYEIGRRRATSLREAFSGLFSRRARATVGPLTFWALRNVTFSLQPGEALGVIGRNGAGKSTLLKLLSRITDPTEGSIRLAGRVGSLLEVGTGFHGELTGRENIFMNGAILGMRRAEIRSRFDEIVAFSEVEDFIDTPVKHYSSGMYMRLAFSVAAHLQPEILIVDEVLAVGDLAFQRKCLGKMGEVARGGRTVLFVSHNLGTIGQLCGRAIWLDKGRVAGDGPAEEVVRDYLRAGAPCGDLPGVSWAPDDGKAVQILDATLANQSGEPCTQFSCDEEVMLRVRLRVRRKTPGLYAYLDLSLEDGTTVLVSDSLDAGTNPLDALDVGDHHLHVTVPRRSIGSGRYGATMVLNSRSADSFYVDGPLVVGRFSVSDTRTWRGDRRRGFLSTLPGWVVATSSAGGGSQAP